MLTELLIVWSGDKITFTKDDNADWTLEVNQDRITDNVWLTRQNSRPIFNIVTESSSDRDNPGDTQWAIGKSNDIGNLSFGDFRDIFDNNIGNRVVGTDLVLYLVTDNVYIDIRFTQWTGDGDGGGFSYERSTEN